MTDGKIYKQARTVAGYTQERWAEALGLTADSVRRYENGERVPDDYTVTLMAEISGLTTLGWWHLRRKSEIAAREMPEVEHIPLSQAVIRLLLAVKEIEPDIDTLLDIARDGAVTPEEGCEFDMVLEDIERLISAAMAVKYAEGAEHRKD